MDKFEQKNKQEYLSIMSKQTVYIVDDEQHSLELIEILTDSAGLNSEFFSSPLEFIKSFNTSLKGCIVLDINMPEMSGLELQKELNKKGSTLPIIFITGYGNVNIAVEAMKAGAIDFLEKPYEGDSLLESIHFALEKNRSTVFGVAADDSMEKRLLSLTPREQEVKGMLKKSLSNKEIARLLNISPRTVEVHRQHIMNKLKIKTVLELP